MTPKNKDALRKRVVKAAEAALAAKGHVSAIDVLVGIEWLDVRKVEEWRRGQIAYLERVVIANLSRISEAMKLFRAWATTKGLKPSATDYLGRRPRRQPLRFSKSGHPAIEVQYRTHWVSAALSERKRERQAEKARRVPELNGGPAIEEQLDMPPLPMGDWRDFDAITEEEFHQAAPPPAEAHLVAHRLPSVRALREKLNLTQEEFAARFHLPLGTVRDWEQGAHYPDETAQVLLTVIARDPDAVARALES